MKTAIFGAGQAGAMAVRWLRAEHTAVCFIDNNEQKQGKSFCGLPVLPLETALKLEPEQIWIAVLNREASSDIREQIASAGFAGLIMDIRDFRALQDIRLAALRLAAEEIAERNVPGDMAELGVYRGVFAAEMNRLLPDRNLYLFDTFSGFDKRDVETEKAFGGRCAKEGDFSDTDIEAVRAALPYPGQAVFVKGYFPESLKAMKEPLPRLALVSLDPDLFSPVYSGLCAFYPLLNPGGVILIHDYNSLQFPGVKQAVRRFCEENGLYVFPLPDPHGTAVLMA